MLLQGYSHVQTGWPVVELKESSRQARSHPQGFTVSAETCASE